MSSLVSLAGGSVCRDLIKPPSNRPCHCTYYVANDTCYDIGDRFYEIENQIQNSKEHFKNKLEGPALYDLLDNVQKQLQEGFKHLSDELEGCDHCTECFED